MKKVIKTAAAALLGFAVLSACNKASAPAESSATFVPESSVGMENPWKSTTDLDEAVKGSGVEFSPPIDVALPELENPIAFFEYQYMDGTISALYEGISDEMIIRKSTKMEGKEGLAGDYNTYSKTWEENIKGLVATCYGDGTLISCAVFSVDDTHFSITFDPGEEDRGLTYDNLKSLIMSMQ